jgi:hypothetical protein
MRPMRPMTSKDPQWPLGLPPKDENVQGYTTPSGNHLEPKERQWPLSLPAVPAVPEVPDEP